MGACFGKRVPLRSRRDDSGSFGGGLQWQSNNVLERTVRGDRARREHRVAIVRSRRARKRIARPLNTALGGLDVASHTEATALFDVRGEPAAHRDSYATR